MCVLVYWYIGGLSFLKLWCPLDALLTTLLTVIVSPVLVTETLLSHPIPFIFFQVIMHKHEDQEREIGYRS